MAAVHQTGAGSLDLLERLRQRLRLRLRGRSLHIYFEVHPRVYAALEEMLALREAGNVEATPLKDSRPGNCDVLESAGALRDGRLAMVEVRYEAPAEVRHFGERVRLTALVDHGKRGSLLDGQLVGFEVPARIRGSVHCPFDQHTQRRLETELETVERDVVTEAGSFFPDRRIESLRVALVECHDLGDFRRVVVTAAVSPGVERDRMCHAGENHGTGQQSQCRCLIHHGFLPCAFSPGRTRNTGVLARCRGESLLTLRREKSGHDVPMAGTNRGPGPIGL